jgi:hypothetical protein
MKLYKLRITGDNSSYNIEYTFSTNFIEYKSFEFSGSEQERYNKFIEELKANGGPQPINIKVKMNTQTTDRALSRNEVLALRDVNDFMKRIGR